MVVPKENTSETHRSIIKGICNQLDCPQSLQPDEFQKLMDQTVF